MPLEALVTALLLGSAPASAGVFGPKVEFNIVVPPAHVLTGVKSVGMGDFGGPQSDKMRDFIQAALLSPSRGASGGYAPADGLSVNVLKVVTQDQADAIIGGTVSMPDPAERDFTQQETRYTNGNKYVVTQVCKERAVKVNFRMSVTGKDGTLLVQEEKSGSNTKSVCKDTMDELAAAIRNGELPTVGNMVDEALRPMAGSLVNSIAPFRQSFSADLLVEKAAKEGNKLAKDDQWQQALTSWMAVLQVDPYNVAAHYNLGVAYEINGHLDEAESWFQKANAIKPTDEATQALGWVQKRRQEIETLTGTYGLPFKPVPLSAPTAGASAGAGLQRVTISGGKNKRVPLRAEAAEGGAPIVQLPGGMGLTVVAVEGGYVKVSTPDGKVGYLLEDEVDGL